MDTRRLNTAQLIGMGITNRQVPETDIPEDRERVDAEGGESFHLRPDEELIAEVESGKVLESANYYGIPYAWKADDGKYRGVLLQYRVVTEDETWETAEEAVEWFKDRYWATDG